MGLLTVSATCHLSASRRSSRRLLASSAEVLWRGVEAAGVADAMIEAEFPIRPLLGLCASGGMTRELR